MKRLHRASFLCLWLGFAAGCGSSPPPEPPVKLFPVKGKLAYKDQSNVGRLERGEVWLQSKSDPAVRGVGQVGDDGSFAIASQFSDKGFSGVPAGDYKVCIQPPLDEDRAPQTNLLDSKYLDFNRSGLVVSVPVEGDLTFEVERPRR